MSCVNRVTPSAWWADLQSYLWTQVGWRESQRDEETVALAELVGRQLAADVVAACNLPEIRRAMMDGVAVNGAEFSAGSGHLTLRGVSSNAAGPMGDVGYPVVTGGPIPESCDSVIPVEHLIDDQGRGPSSEVSAGQVWKVAAGDGFRVGQHVAMIGEDVRLGQCLLSAGRRVRPSDLGLLSACGIATARCWRRPTVRIGLTGGEVVPPGQPKRTTQVFDANGPVLQALTQRDGGQVGQVVYLADDRTVIQDFVRQDDADILLLSGGTSVGPTDLVAEVLRQVGHLDYHGLPLRPGRPVGIGRTHRANVFLLPGNPIACQFTYDLLVRPLLRHLSGWVSAWPYRREMVTVTTEVPSELGRLDYLRVQKVGESPVPLAGPSSDEWNWLDSSAPILGRVVQPLTSGRASNLTSVAHADGFVLIPPTVNCLEPNQPVTCYWYDL